MLVIVSILALLVIAGLIATAVYYLLQLKKQQNRQKQALEQLAQEADAKYMKIRKDIVFIANAYLTDQVELPEASLRISRLVDIVIDERESRDIYAPFDSVADAIKDIPTHKEWQKLDKSERKIHERTMSSLSDLHSVQAKIAAKSIVEQAKNIH